MLNIIHRQFGRLWVFEEKEKRGNYRYFLCRCDCGKEIITRMSNLTTGATKSCGCLQRDTVREMGKSKKTHGLSKTRFYKIWKGIFSRCYNPKTKSFKNYGGRGIEVVVDWKEETKCKKCGKRIWFAKTNNGKLIPIEMVRLAVWDTHFATCPYANEFRKKQ